MHRYMLADADSAGILLNGAGAARFGRVLVLVSTLQRRQFISPAGLTYENPTTTKDVLPFDTELEYCTFLST